MKRTPLYSKSSRARRNVAPASHPARTASRNNDEASGNTLPASESQPRLPRTRALVARHERLLLVITSVLLSAVLYMAYTMTLPAERRYTQRDIDAAVMHTLEKTRFPSPESKAFERIRRSVVRVAQEDAEHGATGGEHVRGIGTGVVIVDTGTILTNLHVVAGAEKIRVRFANGMESDAIVLQKMPENDLAVLQAVQIPDDLVAATLRSTQDLAIGDKVVAVGFPFNIGPSASAGIISGLRRNYYSQDDQQILRNLIQFDAAANPGNSGGPLVTMDGEVVGIVTAILSPHEQGTFIGIGFAVPIEIAAAAAGESPF